jgi:hypothetical protein
MPPSIPTYRPLITATRSAIAIAVIAAGCGVLLALDSAYGRLSTTVIAPLESWGCNDTAGAEKS